MEHVISKSKFKRRALGYFRQIEETRRGLIITDRRKPVLRIAPYLPETRSKPLARFGCAAL